jgi:RNA polymerase sigma-70 factor (ECF subfamily)
MGESNGRKVKALLFAGAPDFASISVPLRNLSWLSGLNFSMILTGNPSFSYPMEKNSETTPFDQETAIDHQLMEMIGAGDHLAFRQLVERHQHAVVGTVSKMLGNANDSEDIAQQVFIRVWKHSKRYKPDNKFTTYLYTITRNLVYNESRRRSRKKTVSSDQLEEDLNFQQAADPAQSPDSELLQAELQKAVDSAIRNLPENQRIAVILRRYENLPYEEIADVLQTSVSSVKSLLFRARTSLRESLSHYLEE